MQLRYYVANAAGAAAIRTFFDQRREAMGHAEALAVELGGEGALCTAEEGVRRMVGVLFPGGDPGPGWMRLKDRENAWMADSGKQGRIIAGRMDGLPRESYATLREVFGLSCEPRYIDKRLFLGVFGVEAATDGRSFLVLSEHEEREPLNAERISDLEYEEHRNKQAADGA